MGGLPSRIVYRARPSKPVHREPSKLEQAIVAQAELEAHAAVLIALHPGDDAFAARVNANVSKGRSAVEKERTVASPSTDIAKAREVWNGTIAAHQQLASTLVLEEEGRISHEYAAKETKRLRDDIRIHDQVGREAMKAAVADTLEAARMMRAGYDSSLEPAVITADELTANRLTKSGSPVDIVDRGRRLVADNQVKAARAYVLAVGTLEPRPQGADMLLQEYAKALNSTDPILRAASDLEKLAVDSEAAFTIERARFLTTSGLGVDRAGDPGTGAPGQTAQSSMAAKLRTWEQDPDAPQAANLTPDAE